MTNNNSTKTPKNMCYVFCLKETNQRKQKFKKIWTNKVNKSSHTITKKTTTNKKHSRHSKTSQTLVFAFNNSENSSNTYEIY